MSEPFLGEIKLFAGNFAPRGYDICDGRLLPISQFSALYSILGTAYGGDGRSTFGLPDLRARVPMGIGAAPGLSPVTWGEKKGMEVVTTQVQVSSTQQELDVPVPATAVPSFTPELQIAAASSNPRSDFAPGRILLKDNLKFTDVADGINVQSMSLGTFPGVQPSGDAAPTTVKVPLNVEAGTARVPTTQPSLGLTYIIAVTGIYPSRD
ncbi:MAG: hypothetical protein MHM6MM_006582 [Cercozoa sp. M6MM]